MGEEIQSCETRECPFCAEVIKVRAIKCKHCGSLLTEEAMARFTEELVRLHTNVPATKASVVAKDVAAHPDESSVPARDGAARLATVLFADLSGFTALSGTREPEEMREIMNALFSDLAGAVERFGGTVDKYIGDCVMAVWGTDEASTDDPIRATNAGLAMLQRMKGRAERLDLPLALHVGVSTGRVVFGTVGAGAGSAKTVLGETVNLAARLCDKAPAGELHVSEETWRRVSERFAATTVERDLKGIGRVRAYNVIPRRSSRRDSVTRRVVVDFQGREIEIGRLAAVLEAHREGAYDRASGILVIGQGGVGKSRLCAYALRHHGTGARILFAQAVPAETPAFGALVAAWLHELIGGGDPATINTFFATRPHLARYRPAVNVLFASADEAAQSTGYGAGFPLDRELAQFFVEVSRAEPLILAGADLQWADPLSVDLCIALAEPAVDGRIALLLDGRPGSNVDRLKVGARFETVELGVLSLETMAVILRSILDTPPPHDWVRMVRERTGGVFIHFNQVLDALAETGILEKTTAGRWRLTEPDRDLPVPDSLQDLIWLRIEHLPTWPRELLLHAAICGVRFPVRLLETAIGRTAEELDGPLRDLIADGFLHGSRTDNAMLAFEHGSIRETARRMLLKSERRRIAERILGTIESRLSEDVIRPLAPDLFKDAGREIDLRRFLASDAYRLIRSFRLNEARALLAAVGREPWPASDEGERAQATFLTAMSRLAEAEHDLDNAFARQDEAVKILRRRAPRSTDLARALGLLGRIATKREDWEMAVAVTTEAREMSEEIGDERSQGIHIFMLGWIAEQREDWPTALRYFQESLSLQRSVRGLRVSHGSIGRAAIELGEIDLAHHHGFEALESAHRDDAMGWNPHAYVSILSTTGRAAWKKGDAATALLHLGTGLDLARATSDDEALFMMLCPLMCIATEAEMPDLARDFAQHVIETAKRLKYPRWERRARRLIEAQPAGPGCARLLPPGISSRLKEICDSLDGPPPRRESIRPVDSVANGAGSRSSVVDE